MGDLICRFQLLFFQGVVGKRAVPGWILQYNRGAWVQTKILRVDLLQLGKQKNTRWFQEVIFKPLKNMKKLYDVVRRCKSVPIFPKFP